MGTTVQAFTTFDEFLKLPNPPAGHLELHHGEVIVVPPRKYRHAKIQYALLKLLEPLLSHYGVVMSEFPFRVPGHEACQADIGFVREDRDREAEISDFMMGAPDLVVEVLSPSNSMDDMNDKMDVCMANGCLSFWVVDPKRRVVSVTEGLVTKHYLESMSIPLSDPFRGTISVAAIFRKPGS
jgi:Uma2 family endonuclease